LPQDGLNAAPREVPRCSLDGQKRFQDGIDKLKKAIIKLRLLSEMNFDFERMPKRAAGRAQHGRR